MKNGIYTIILALLFVSCQTTTAEQKTEQSACETQTCCQSKANTLTDAEKVAGWSLLFDGKSMDQWMGFHNKDVSGGWVIEDNCLKSLGRGGDIGGDLISVKQYENFEITFEWRIAHGGNSGFLYGVSNDPKYKAIYYTGPEYQLLDDVGFPAKIEEWQMTGANYGMNVADKRYKSLQMVGGEGFNSTRLIVNKKHVEHWLNGKKIVEFERWTDEWNHNKGAGKWKDYPDYGTKKVGHLSLQDHGSFIWFKNIKIRELS